MERTKKPLMTNEQAQQIHTFASELVARNAWATALGVSFAGKRDLYQALGYADTLTYRDYANQYKRQDIAKAVIDRPAKATWQGPLLLLESKIEKESPLEKAWKALNETLHLKTKFQRADRLSGIGGYSIILLGLDDVTNKEGFQVPVKSGARKLVYIKAYGEGSAKISALETNPNNPRYGMPLMYQITATDVRSGLSGGIAALPNDTINVHYTRIIHIIDDALENEIVGIPRLEAIFNRLQDLEKIVGGDAEMFWRNARPGYQGIVEKDFTLTTEMRDALKEQIDEYEHNLRRMLINEGIKYEALVQTISDPKSHVDIQIQMISAVTGIPKRVLTGTERGELASSQDATEWRAWIQSRREDFAEPNIVRPFVNRCIELNILPKPKEDYSVLWSDLYAMSEAEVVKIGLDRATALKNYASVPMAETYVPPNAFMEYFLGLNDDQIELVRQMVDESLQKERIDQLFEEPEPVPVQGKPKENPTKALAKKPISSNELIRRRTKQ